MASLHIPPLETKKWTQPNLGDLMGVLWATYNMDLSLRPGKVNISDRTYEIMSDAVDADFQYPSAAIRTSADGTDRWWIYANAVLFKSTDSDPSGTYAQDAIANSPVSGVHPYGDLAEHEGALIHSIQDDLNRLAGGTWTRDWWNGAGNLNQTALASNTPHPLDVFKRILIIGDGNLIHIVDRNLVPTYQRLTLPSYLEARCIRHSQNRVWIGCRHKFGGNAEIIEWDGVQETFLNQHVVHGKIVLAITVKNGTPWAITNTGILLKHNGYTFVTETYLPIANEIIYESSGSSRQAATLNDGFGEGYSVHWNGMTVIDDKIHFLLNGAIAGSLTQNLDNMHGGIWCYDENVGLYHRYALSRWRTSTVVDFSQQIFEKTGMLVNTGRPDKGLFLAGAKVSTDNTSTSDHGLFIKDTGQTLEKRGYFITTQIQTANVEDMWAKLWAKFKKFRSSTLDAIVIKARGATDVDYNFPFRAGITWLSANSFTGNATGFASVIGGEEVEIFLGDGGGTTAHVSTITGPSGGLYTVTLDESPNLAAGTHTSQVRITKFRKLGIISGDTTISIKDLALGQYGAWCQLKVELRGQKDTVELEELLVSTQKNIETQNS